MSWLGRWMKPSFANGVHVPEWKLATEARPIRRLDFAPRLILPLNQHIGAPSVPTVRKGQEVVRGEPVARADGFLSLPLHAPASGVIEEIGLVAVASGLKVPGIVLKVYEASTQELLYANPRDVRALTPAEIVQAVQDTGMAGMGGAAFPTHAKLQVRADKPIDTLVANGCECEPYLTCDYRVMLEHPEDLIAGIDLAMRAVGARRTLVGIEDNKPQAIAALRARLPRDGRIRVEPVRTKYPQGSAELLIKALMGCEVPAGGRSFDVGAVVQNVGTLVEIGRLLPQGAGLIERVVTITGPGIRNPGNYTVPLGTPMRFVLEQVGFTGSYREIILGG
ncbi:MAG: RnfABCDGE type electron transport complex subunit C, partial [Gammaproteobacteria bacterium]|nr:RnfABCDGE type electron transport complex subunit C [Gammaproteobacteria bacterium]